MNTRFNTNLFLKTLEDELKVKAKELSKLDEMVKNLKAYFAPKKEENYHHLGVSGAIRKYLEETKEVKTTREIADELQSYGIYSKSSNFYNNVNVTLHRMSDVEKTDAGWKLKGN